MDRFGNIASAKNASAKFVAAYSQAPWRKQVRIIGLFSLCLVFLSLVAGIYLMISANTVTVGRDIQAKQGEIEDIEREIEEMRSQLAHIQSAEVMRMRALSLGFKPVSTEELIYLPVPGYVERQPAVLAPYSLRQIPGASVVPARYTETIFDWLKRTTDWSPSSIWEGIQ